MEQLPLIAGFVATLAAWLLPWPAPFAVALAGPAVVVAVGLTRRRR